VASLLRLHPIRTRPGLSHSHPPLPLIARHHRLAGLLPRGPVADTFSRLGNAIADSRRANKWLAGVGPLLELRASSALHKDPEWTNWALRIGAEVALFSSILAEHL